MSIQRHVLLWGMSTAYSTNFQSMKLMLWEIKSDDLLLLSHLTLLREVAVTHSRRNRIL